MRTVRFPAQFQIVGSDPKKGKSWLAAICKKDKCVYFSMNYKVTEILAWMQETGRPNIHTFVRASIITDGHLRGLTLINKRFKVKLGYVHAYNWYNTTTLKYFLKSFLVC